MADYNFLGPFGETAGNERLGIAPGSKSGAQTAAFVSLDVGGEKMTPEQTIVHLLDQCLRAEVPPIQDDSIPSGDEIPF